MDLRALIVATILIAAPAAAQDRAVSPQEHTPAAPPTAPASVSTLPVSLDRIREALKRAEPPILLGLNRQADFRVEIQEKQKLEEMLKRLDVKAGPVPAGGLYMYEQQRMLFNPTDRPLMQPYAAFSGGELITIAIQNLLARYLGKPLLESATNAYHSRQYDAAKEEVRRSIAEYCAGRPDFMDIRLCNPDAR